MTRDFRDWMIRRAGTGSIGTDSAEDSTTARGDIRVSHAKEGPWLFVDPMDRTWVLSIVPLEYDPTLPTRSQLNALVCSCDDGWLFAIPVGAGFDLEGLNQEEVSRLLVVAEGNARQESDWEPSRSEARAVREPTSGRVFQVRVVTREWAAPVAWRSDAPRSQVLLFQERGGPWSSSIPLPNGTTMESLSREDLLHLLWPALALEGQHSPSRALAERSRPSAGHDRTSKLILLVEDHRDLRKIYRYALEHAGFVVIEAGDGKDALALVDRYGAKLRAVVTDVVMPRVGGRELLWRLSEQQPGLPVILISGLLDQAQAASGLAPEPVWFLRKPFAPPELVALVQRALGTSPNALPQE